MAWILGLTLGACLLLGGGTHAGFLGDVLCQVLAVPLFVAVLFELQAATRTQYRTTRIAPLIALLALAFVQLTPLPPALALALPGRELARSAFELAGTAGQWHPVSLAPAATTSALLSLLPPVAIYMGVGTLDIERRRSVVGLVLLLTAISLVVGLLQVAQGPGTPLRFFAVTNPNEAVGFFANRNHFAALLYSALVLTGTAIAISLKGTHSVRLVDRATAVRLTMLAVLFIGIFGGLFIARSRAGVILAMAALVGIALLYWSAATPQRQAKTHHASRLMMALITLAVLIAAQFGLHRIMSRFEADPLTDLRLPLASTTLEAALATLPLGTGAGTFVPVYAHNEKAHDIVAGFANRAHNDFAEWTLEAGVAAVFALVAFFVWFTRQALRIWRQPGHAPDERTLQQGATIVIALLAAHALVDYPLRTTAIASLFAFCCGLLIPAPAGQRHRKRHTQAAPHGSHHHQATNPPSSPDRSAAPSQPARTWHATTEWPEAWRPRKPNHDTPDKR